MQEGWTNATSTKKVVELESGIGATGISFGNFKMVEISGYKYEDKNNDGYLDEGEGPLAGWIIELTKLTGTSTTTSTTTDAKGFYRFMDVVPGDYQISESSQT